MPISSASTACSKSPGLRPDRSTRSPRSARERTEAAIERSLAAARELLGMRLAHVAEADGGEGSGSAEAAAVAVAAGHALGCGDEPLALSCGVAELRPGARPAELFRAADSAQYEAKRAGGGRVVVAEGDLADHARGPGRRAARDRTDAETRALAERLLDVIAHAPEHERVERLAGALRRS